MKERVLMLFACLFASVLMAVAQTSRITGIVVDETGEPVIGASVLVDGTNRGAVTNIDGEFTIENVPTSASTITVSYVGYQSVQVQIERTYMRITLRTDTELLEEVVVTAQGLTRKEKSLGYSTQKVDAEKLTIARQTDLGNSLAGKISGARFFSSSGSSFGDGSIVLRGTTGFSYDDRAGSEPIYVVDGTITNKNSVNMDDVESINVLKGPAATALYGSQGANGAVIITSKGATSNDGKGHIEVSHTLAFEKYYNHYNFQKSYGGGSYGLYGQMYGTRDNDPSIDYMSPEFLLGNFEGQNDDGSYIYDMYSDEDWGPRYDPNVKVADALYYDPTSQYYGQAMPWVHNLDLADLYRTGMTNTTNVSFSKSNVNHTTRISFTNSQRDGIVQNSDQTRRYLTVKEVFKPTDWLNVNLDYKFTYRRNHNAHGEGYGGETSYNSDFTQWGQTNVDITRYKDYARPDGSWRTWNPIAPDDLTANFHDNPYAVMDTHNSYSTSIWNVITGDVEAILPYNFKAGFRVMGNMRNNNDEWKYSDGSINYVSQYREDQYHIRDFTYQGRLTWGDRFINDRLSVDAAAFVEQRNYNYGYLRGNTTDGLNINDYFNLAATNGYVNATNTEQHYKTRSLFGTVTAGFDDTYFIDLSLRNDWDSRLPQAHNSYLYGGASISVMMSQLIKADWLDFWKLRASAAQVGSTLGVYNTSYTYGVAKYNTLTGLQQSTTQLNQNIKPTVSTSYEIGTEFRLFQNRFWGDINFYRRDSKNQILNVDVAPQSGFSTRQINAGLVRNQGIEIQLGVTPIRSRDFQWDIEGNIAKNQNKLVRLTEGMNEYQLYWNQFYYPWYMYSVVGEPVGEIRTGARWARNDNGELILRKTTGNAQYTWGEYQPTYELNDIKSVGNFQPKFTGGFSTTLRYKQLSLAATFDFQIGGKLVSWTNMWGQGSGTIKETAEINDRGVNVREPISRNGGVHVVGVDQEGNKVDTYMNAYQYYHYKAYYDNDEWVYDRSYVKMREIALSYAFTKSQLSKLNVGLESASISLVATNPWLLYSAIPNIDPSEAGTNYIEGGQSPSTRSVGVTVRLGF